MCSVLIFGTYVCLAPIAPPPPLAPHRTFVYTTLNPAVPPPPHPPQCAWILYAYEPICHYVPQPRHECGIATLHCCWGATCTLPDL